MRYGYGCGNSECEGGAQGQNIDAENFGYFIKWDKMGFDCKTYCQQYV